MHECRIYETKPFLKKDPSFPLRAFYKKPFSVVRAEPDGSIFSYHSPHSMNVYLSLRYSRLYLNWGFVEDENNLRLFEYNTEFPLRTHLHISHLRRKSAAESLNTLRRNCHDR